MARSAPLRARTLAALAGLLMAAFDAPSLALGEAGGGKPESQVESDPKPAPKTAGKTTPVPATQAQVDVVLPARVDAIEVRGLSFTRVDTVLRELPYRAGDVVTPAAFDLGLTRLWDTPMFARVSGRTEARGKQNVVVIDVEERWPITPVLEFQSGGSATWFHVGATDRNLLGRYLELEGFYEYFNGQSGGRVWFRDARLFDERLELRLIADRLMRTRPNYTVRTTRGRFELSRYELDDYIKFGIRLDGMQDEFFEPLDGSNPPLPGTVRLAIAEPGLRVGRVDNLRLRDRGVTLEARVAGGYTSRADARYWRRLWMELNANAIAGERWNFGLRVQAASVSASLDELQFFIGGLDLLRGYADNYYQATAYTLYNADVKYIVFDSTWIAMLPTVFSDGAAIRRADGTTDAAMSVGAGLLFVIPKIADSQLRIDVAVPLRSPYTPGLGLGSAVFF